MIAAERYTLTVTVSPGPRGSAGPRIEIATDAPAYVLTYDGQQKRLTEIVAAVIEAAGSAYRGAAIRHMESGRLGIVD